MSANAAPRFLNAADLDPSLADAVVQYGMAFGDVKYLMGLRISEWCTGAPTLEACVAVSAITQDELGHARALYALYRDFPNAPETMRFEGGTVGSAKSDDPLLGQPWESYHDLVATVALLDFAVMAGLESQAESQFAPLRARIQKILQEERFHRVFAQSCLARISGESAKARERLQQSIHRVWPIAEAWFDSAGGATAGPLLENGIIAEARDAQRAQWVSRAAALIRESNLKTP